ncbi:hypothetical protein [Halanaerobacter jeridensis]|uniref:Uncharacterized protein n=1 Tax=Halanaerobacter jeridensis TaxID=706427 RepID=A0A938XUW1_9FIRM|nr:hypothetical protein [Halanaerobacter jeridensis]MBM7556766.1 hypothetical protein [Halanaerobacter jeridensis]
MDVEKIKGDFYFMIVKDSDDFTIYKTEEEIIDLYQENKVLLYKEEDLLLEDISTYSDDNFVVGKEYYDYYNGMLVGFFESNNIAMTIILVHLASKSYYKGDPFNLKRIVKENNEY